MCGIVGHVGAPDQAGDRRAEETVLGGLERLEYRGYDSAGIAVMSDSAGIVCRKVLGGMDQLHAALQGEPLPAGPTAIGHTRWATHGKPSQVNAHPHLSYDGRVAIVHNGIIENHEPLRAELAERGIECISDTDTEVLAHRLALLMSEEQRGLADAVGHLSKKLEGTFTIVAMAVSEPHILVATRRSSPLLLGVGDGEMYAGSDVAAFIARTQRVLEVSDDQVAVLSAQGAEIFDAAGQPVTPKSWTVDWDTNAAVKGGFDTFMEKEIHDQPAAVHDTLRGRIDEAGRLHLDDTSLDDAYMREIHSIIVVACGSAAYAGQVARYAIEHWVRIPVEVELAHEFRYRDPVLTAHTLVVAVSQSGETMDTLQAVRHAREQGARVLSIVNTFGSTIARESDAVLYTHAGPEVAVASTKAFLAQVTACYLLGLFLAQVRGNKFPDEVADYLANLEKMPGNIATVLERIPDIHAVAERVKDADSFLFIGRHVGFPVALEGALKLKEIAYVHAEGFAAGELKHGPIALIEPGQIVVIVVPTRRRPMLHNKVLSNVAEVRARGAFTIVVAEDGDEAAAQVADAVLSVPPAPTLLAPLVTTVPLQILAQRIATLRGLNVDKPRNLAKSVTVE